MSKTLIAALCLIVGVGLSLAIDSPIPGLILAPVALYFVFSELGLFAWFRDNFKAVVDLRRQMKNSKQ